MVPVNVVVGEAASVNDPPVPDTTLQAPVPETGVFAVIATVAPQEFLSAPALAIVGPVVKVTTTSSVDVLQGVFEVVQRNV